MNRFFASAILALGMVASLAVTASAQVSGSSDPVLDRVPSQEQQAGSTRAHLWAAQQVVITNRKSKSETNVRQLESYLDRANTYRNALVQERDQKIEQMVTGTLRAGGNSENLGEAFLKGLVGGAATRFVADQYNQKIADADSKIADAQGKLNDWRAEVQRCADRQVQNAGWPMFQGHRYPIVIKNHQNGAAQNLDIREGDLYISYNGQSLSYVTVDNLNAARDDARTRNVQTADLVIARNGKLIRYQVDGGKPLGIEVRVPIYE